MEVTVPGAEAHVSNDEDEMEADHSTRKVMSTGFSDNRGVLLAEFLTTATSIEGR